MHFVQVYKLVSSFRPPPPLLVLERGDLVGEDEGEGWRRSVEEDGVWVSVGHLSHVLEYVLLGDDSQQPPENGERKKNNRR